MADQDTFRRTKAIFREYFELARKRSFLPRNIATVLQAHEYDLALRQDPDTHDPLDKLKMNRRVLRDHAYADKASLVDSVIPIADIIEKTVLLTRERRRPIMRIDKLRISPPRRPGKPNTRRTRHRISETDPDWMPASNRIFTADCRISIRIWNADGSPLHIVTYCGSLRAFRNTHDVPHFEAIPDKPIEIDVRNLLHTRKSKEGPPDSERWKRAAFKTYKMEIVIECTNTDSAAEFIGLLTDVAPKSLCNKPEKELKIKAWWRNLPEAPDEDMQLPIFRSVGNSELRMEYRMRLSSQWNNGTESAWDLCRDFQRSQHASQQQLLTPDSSEISDTRPRQYTIQYFYREQLLRKYLIARHLRCVLCLTRRDYNSFVSLMLHYQKCHDHFLMEVSHQQIGPDGHFSAHIAFVRAGKSVMLDDPSSTSWIAPARPFDAVSCIKGDDSWIHARARKPTRVRSKITVIPKRHKRIDEIQDLPSPKRRRYPPLHVPGVTFYHTTSKQPAAEDDSFSEEDDQIDDSRLKPSQRRNLLQLRLSEQAADFHLAFNCHLDREMPESDCFLREAVVRFARNHRRELRCPDWTAQFRAKLNLLLRDEIIDEEVFSYCLQDSSEQSAAESPRHDNLTRSAANKVSRLASSARDTRSSPSSVVVRTEVPESPDADRATRSPSTFSTPAHDSMRSRRPRMQLRNGKLNVIGDNPDEISEIRSRRGNSLRVESPVVDRTNRPGSTPQTNHSRLPTAQLHKSIKGRCICGEVAYEGPGSIGCEAQSCVRRNFHTSCVGLERPIMDWRCVECAQVAKASHDRGAQGWRI